MSRMRNCLVTVFFEGAAPKNDEWWQRLHDLPGLRFAVGQYELCPTSHRVHFQGYLEFTERISRVSLKKLLNNCHVEPRKGNQQQAIDYCTKEQTRIEGCTFEVGVKAKSGQRNDLNEVAESIYSGKSLREIQEEYPKAYIMYSRGIKDLYYTVNNIEPRSDPPVVIYCYGETGTGKTKYAKNYSKSVYFKNMSCKWWDGYNGQEVVVFDDIRGDTFKYHELLRILDRYVPYEYDNPPPAPLVGILCILNIKVVARI